MGPEQKKHKVSQVLKDWETTDHKNMKRLFYKDPYYSIFWL